MIVVFLIMYTNFVKNKRQAMKDKLIRWKCKNTFNVIAVYILVFLNAGRSIVKVITMHGFLGDDDVLNYSVADYKRTLYDFGVSSVTDFAISMAVLRLIYVKNKDNFKMLLRRMRNPKEKDLSNLIDHSS